MLKYALGFLETGVEVAIKRFSLVALSYQPYFNIRIRSYTVHELTTRQNRTYFNTLLH